MLFKTLKGNEVNVFLSDYKINWRKPSASKFQTRVKNFFWKHFNYLEWYEECPCAGEGMTKLRFDFLCVFEDNYGKKQRIFVECHGQQHVKLNNHFHGTMEKFEDQMMRDILKEDFAKINSQFPLIEIYEEDEPLSIKWLEQTYPGVFPRPRKKT